MGKNTSFLPDDYLEKRVVRRTNILCLLLFVLVMVGIGGAYYLTYQRAVELSRKQAHMDQREQEVKKQLSQLEKLHKQRKRMMHKARVTSALVERVPRSMLLAELINHMPSSLSVLDLNSETRVLDTGPRPTTAMEKQQLENGKKNINVKPKQISVDLVGIAPTDVQVSEYMTSLSQHRLFSEVNLQYSEQTDLNGSEMRKFRLKIKVANEVDMREIEPTKIARDLKQDPMSDEVQINASGQMTPVKNALDDESSSKPEQ